MRIRVHALLLTAGIGLISTSASGITPNPTPNLKSGDYQAALATVTVDNPTVYGRNNVSAHKKNWREHMSFCRHISQLK